jgi:putative oxidoreductase
MDVLLSRLFDTRAPLAQAALAVRLAAGVTFVGFSLGKFIRHDAERGAFERYGIPFPDAATYLIGGLELVGGAALLIGLLVRPFALALACNMVGAISTAGHVDGGPVRAVGADAARGHAVPAVGGPGRSLILTADWWHAAGSQNRPPA